MNEFVCLPSEILQAKLSTGATKALLGLLSYRNYKTGQCNPKIGKLCERLGGVSNPTVRRWLRELRQAGILEATKQRGRENSYRILTAIKSDRTSAIKSDRSVRSKMTVRPLSILYELDEGKDSVAPKRSAGSLPNQNHNGNTVAVPRKSITSETLEAYYRLYAKKAE